MTEQSSYKSFFGKYLLYRINVQKMNLIFCCIINFFTLPLFAAARIKGFDDSTSLFFSMGVFFPVIGCLVLIVLAAIGAVFSFEYYNKKMLTDIVGSLPLSYKQRFWGDFLAGYITNVAPVIPFGIISVVLFANAQQKFEEYCGSIVTFGAFQYALYMVFSLFITLTFVYMFAVLVTSACGKVLHSVLFSIFVTAAVAGTAVGLSGCFAIGMRGVAVTEYMSKAATFVPPLGSLIDAFNGYIFFDFTEFNSGNGSAFGGIPLEKGIGDVFAAVHIPNILVFVILGVGITAGAFYIGKRRDPEKTGSAFVVKRVYYAVSALMTAAATLIIYIMNYRSSNSGKIGYISACIAGAVVWGVSTVMYLPKLKELLRCVVCGFVTIEASLWLVALLNSTGSFGAMYIPEDAEKIEYLKVDDNFTIYSKTDIQKFIENHNKILRANKDILRYGTGSYSLEYKTASGKITTLSYSGSSYELNRYPLEVMRDNERTLSGYGRYYFEMMFERNAVMSDYHIIENDLTYDIPEQYREEFIDTLSREAEEKYDPDAEVYARLEFSGWGGHYPFYIGKNLEKTVTLLESIKGTVEIDPNTVIIQIDYQRRTFNYDEENLTVLIKNKDMDNELVKELVDLLVEYGDDLYTENGNFRVYYKNVSGSNYYVPNINTKRVMEIMTELAIQELG